MRPVGPTEEDKNYIADTGASQADMKEQVAAYKASMLALKKKVVPMGGYWWQLMDSGNTKLAGIHQMDTAKCKAALAPMCVPKPSSWNKLTLNNIPGGGKGTCSVLDSKMHRKGAIGSHDVARVEARPHVTSSVW
jgi:hypothetical protein